MGIICCKSNKNNLAINENIETIRLENNSGSEKKNNNIPKKEHNIIKSKGGVEILDDSTEENKINQQLYKEKKQTKQSEKVNILTKITNQQNRRKSISISINQLNQLTNKYTNQTKIKRREGRSRSAIHYNRTYDLTNFRFKFKEIYNKLPTNKITSKKMLKINNINEDNNEKKKASISSINSESVTINSSSQEKNNKNHHLDIEEINEPFSEKQINTLKQILIQEELIIDEMDEDTINLIINATSYIRVKAKVIIFSKESPPGDYFYMIEKGQLTYSIDGDIYELPKLSGIGTSALIKNCKKSCFLISIERCYLFKLPIEKYKQIAENFYNNLHNLKKKYLSSHFFFSGIDKNKLDILADLAVKTKYNKKTLIIEEDQFNNSIFMVLEGSVLCSKDDLIIKKIYPGEIFGEIGIFNQIESLYAYYATNDSVILSISYEQLFMILGDNAVKNIVYHILERSIKRNEILNQYFDIGDNKSRLFNSFQFKFYFNDIILTPKEKKIIIPISGTVFKYHHKSNNIKEHIGNFIYQSILRFYCYENNTKIYLSNISTKPNSIQNSVNNTQRLFTKEKSKQKDLIEKGELFIESITVQNDLSYSLLGDECLIFECLWNDIEKNLNLPSPETKLPLFDRINLLKPIPSFKLLSPLHIFQLANNLHLTTFRKGEIIIKDGPTSDKLYIIKNGNVEIKKGSKTLKMIEPGHSFGDIFSQIGAYTRKADFVSNAIKMECYYILKDNYDEIVGFDSLLNPINLHMKDITITLDNLYYIRDLGSGAYGKVYLVHDKKRFYAMKTADIQTMNQMKEMANLYINEKNIMFSVDHPFIISIINTFKTKDYLFFLMEYVDGMTLRKYLNIYNRKKNDLYEVKFYGASLSLVLSYLQKKKIIHRDLKPDNLMLEYTGYLKVIDFGVAKDTNGKDFTNSFIGTTHYMAPEVILGKNYNTSVDYWSMGIILYEMYYGKLPFGNDEKDGQKIYREITDKKITFPNNDNNNESLNELLSGLLTKNPKKRINNFNKIKGEKFFQGFDFDSLMNLKIKGYYQFDQNLKEKDLKYTDVSFIHFMRNNLNASSGELDEFLTKNNDDMFIDF